MSEPTKIVMVDDGKEKYQSHEAHVDLDHHDAFTSITCNIVTFGSTPDEARVNLLVALRKQQSDISELLSTLM